MSLGSTFVIVFAKKVEQFSVILKFSPLLLCLAATLRVGLSAFKHDTYSFLHHWADLEEAQAKQ